MSVNDTTEKRFESDIEAFFLSAAGGYTKCEDAYDPKLGLYPDTLIRFIQTSQPKAWQRFVNMNAVDPVRKFCAAFNNACDMNGILDVLRHGRQIVIPGKSVSNSTSVFWRTSAWI